MPRRPSKKNRVSKTKPKPLNRSDGTIKKWNTLDDIPMDDQDQFHASKDKILLEGEDAGGYSDDGDEDEVFALKGVDLLSDEDAPNQEYDYDEEDEDEGLGQEAVKVPVSKKKDKNVKKLTKPTIKAPASDEEQQSSGTEDESWGQGRAAYYSSNANQIESDDDEANELEQQEAMRLQVKIRQELTDEDFGLGDLAIENREDTDIDLDSREEDSIQAFPTDKRSIIRHLEKTNPESLALARDWDDTVHKLQKTHLKIEKTEAEKSDSLSLGMIHIHYQTLLSYSTVLAFYLHLRASPKYSQRPSLLQSHPIMQRLLTLKQALHTLEDLDFAVSDDEDGEGSYEGELDMFGDAESLWQFDHSGGLEPNELNDLLNDADLRTSTQEFQMEKPPKKKRKVVQDKGKGKELATSKAKSKTKDTPVFDLVEPEFVSSKSVPTSSTNNVQDAFGDATSLSAFDAADKTARTKSLRFHTSKIESAAARRQGARNQAIGGDDDIPYRERKKEKESRLVAEAVRRAERDGTGAELDEDEPEPKAGQKRSRGEEDEGEEVGVDEYYDLVKRKSLDEKAKKKDAYEEEHGFTRVPLEGENSGPRSLTRTILKNRGLTPSRPKSVRNPRVKKRQKYDKAKKKLSSQKAVYNGGLAESKGRYDGEKTGISKVVKSVRLG